MFKVKEIIWEDIVTTVKYSNIKLTKDKHLKLSNNYYISIKKSKSQ